MNTKEFAIKFAGKRARLTGYDVPRFDANPEPYCRIIGYRGLSLIVDFEDKEDNSRAWDIRDYNDIKLVVGNPSGRGWSVNPEYLVFNTKPQILYPHTCSVCQSRARKNKFYILCSNVHCGSHRKLKKILGFKNQKGSIARPLRIRCPTCKKYCYWLQSPCYSRCDEHGKFEIQFVIGSHYVYRDSTGGKRDRIAKFVGKDHNWWDTSVDQGFYPYLEKLAK